MDRIVKKGIIGVVLFLVLMVSGVTGLRTYAYQVGEKIPKSDYLTFTAEEDNSSVRIGFSAGSLKYNKGGSWADYTLGTEIKLNQGEKVSFCGTNVTFSASSRVNITGKVAASGDVCSLRLDTNGDFAGLSDSCFQYMFLGCSGLTKAPKLSATTLAKSCYNSMFANCTSLTEPPALPATTLAVSCYHRLFFGCMSLTKAPALPATDLAESCYTQMFTNCRSLKKAPELPATDLAASCYEDMFTFCMSLTEPPALPATDLADNCYCYMFYGCEKIMLSTNQNTDYNAEYRIPSSGIGTTTSSRALYNMFSNTGGEFTGTPEINTIYYIHKPVSLSETSLTIEKGEVKKLTATIDPDIQNTKVKWEAICENGEIGLYSDEECTNEITSDETEVLSVYVKGKNISSKNVTVKVTVKDSGNNAYSSECSVGVSLVAPTFTVTIPATIEFDGTGTATASMDIKFNDLYSENLGKAAFINQEIVVTLAEVNGVAINSGTEYYLLNKAAPRTSTDDHTPDVEFTMNVINTDNDSFDPRTTYDAVDRTTSALLKAFAENGSNYYCEDSASFEFHLQNADKLPVGEYKGTLTFSVSTKTYDPQDFVSRIYQDPCPIKYIPSYND